MRANLLTHLQSLAWENLSIDRKIELDNLILALECARSNGDIIYSTPEIINLELPWGFFYDIIAMDHQTKLTACPWLTRDHQKIIGKIVNAATTKLKSLNLAELSVEFPHENNSWFGIEPIELPKYVSDEPSWKAMHSGNISTFYSSIDKNTAYFQEFYIPILTIKAGSLKESIRRGREHRIFKRLDLPSVVENDITLHGEQIQMHFNDTGKSALNMNGEWKHGGFSIPIQAIEKLIEWGFKVSADSHN